MLRLTIRFLGLLCLAAGFADLIVDGTRSIAAGELTLMPAGHLVMALFPEHFEKFHAEIVKAAPFLWDPVMTHVLRAPIWLIAAIVGLILVVLTRPPRKKIGYSRR